MPCFFRFSILWGTFLFFKFSLLYFLFVKNSNKEGERQKDKETLKEHKAEWVGRWAESEKSWERRKMIKIHYVKG